MAVDHVASRKQRQERLTLVGPGTPMGKYMRCFWQPVAAVAELAENPVIAVRVLGESLALYRNENGSYGLVTERCPHRGTSLACGMLEDNHIVCAYHAWKFDGNGNCVETPAEPREQQTQSTHQDRRLPGARNGRAPVGLYGRSAGAVAAAFRTHGA